MVQHVYTAGAGVFLGTTARKPYFKQFLEDSDIKKSPFAENSLSRSAQ